MNLTGTKIFYTAWPQVGNRDVLICVFAEELHCLNLVSGRNPHREAMPQQVAQLFELEAVQRERVDKGGRQAAGTEVSDVYLVAVLLKGYL